MTNVNINSHRKTVMCFITTYSRHYEGDGYFNIFTDFDPNLCTHIIYAFFGINETSFDIRLDNPYADLNIEDGGQDGIREIVNLRLKFPHLKIMASVGGWVESQTESFSKMVSSHSNRKLFIKNVGHFLRNYKFDGLDFYWQFPDSKDKDHFVQLLKEIKSDFKKRKWILSVFLSHMQDVINSAYDVKKINEFSDYLNIFTYDYHGYWESKTGHNSPLRGRLNGFDKNNNVEDTIERYLKLGVDSQKVNIGLTFSGMLYKLDKHPDKKSEVWISASKGPMGPWTGRPGFATYRELNRMFTQQWECEQDTEQGVPYAYFGNGSANVIHQNVSPAGLSASHIWVSFEDPSSIKEKVGLVSSRDLGGVFIFSIDMDLKPNMGTHNGECSTFVKSSLLLSVNEELAAAYKEFVDATPGFSNEISNYKETNNSSHTFSIYNNTLVTLAIITVCLINISMKLC